MSFIHIPGRFSLMAAGLGVALALCLFTAVPAHAQEGPDFTVHPSTGTPPEMDPPTRPDPPRQDPQPDCCDKPQPSDPHPHDPTDGGI